MKKFLVVLLACAMIFGFASTAFAADTQMADFSDIADQTQAAKTAIMKLAILGVVEGNEGIGGAFRPSDNLTRAEFAKIVNYLTANVKNAESMASVGSRFPDVAVGNWYTGWVNGAAAKGYMVGDVSGSFRPNSNITMNEVVTVALRAVGYNDNVSQRRGTANRLPWPTNYVTKATDVGILDDVNFVGSQPATRADMAIIVNAVLDLNMVEYIESDMAFSLALSQGTVDPDGFSEIYYISNETERYNEYERILHKAFNCINVRSVFEFANGTDFDEAAAWDYDNLKDGELLMNFYNGYRNRLDVDSTYYINKDYKLPQLGGMQADIVINIKDDVNEVKFVNVRGTTVYANAVYMDNSGRIVADSKTYTGSDKYLDSYDVTEGGDTVTKTRRIMDLNAGVTDADGYFGRYNIRGTGDNVADKDNTMPAKLYVDKDGYVYAVKSYNVFRYTGFGIFDELDGNIVNYVEQSWVKGDDVPKFDTTKDHVVIADNSFIKAEEIDSLDVVYYMGESYGVQQWLVLPSAEGEMTNQNRTDGKLTIDGTSMAAVNADRFMYSNDGGETFITPFNLKTIDVEKEDFGEAIYAKSYCWPRLAYAAANTNFAKIIGVITNVDPSWGYINGSFQGRVENITIYNSEGKEVTYKFTKDFRNGLNYFMNWYTEDNGTLWLEAVDKMYPKGTGVTTRALDAVEGLRNTTVAAGVVGFTPADDNFQEGDIVQLVLDKNDNVKRIDNFASYALSGLDVDVKVNSSRERLTIDKGDNGFSGFRGTWTLPKDAIVFAVSPDADGDYDEVDIVSAASVLSADFTTKKTVSFDVKKTGDINVLYYIGDVSVVKFGVATRKGTVGDGYYYLINGVQVPAANYELTHSPAVVAYTISAGEAKIIDYLAWYVDNKDGKGNQGPAVLGANAREAWVSAQSSDKYHYVLGTVSNITTAGGRNAVRFEDGTFVYATADTFLYDLMEDDDAILNDLTRMQCLAIYGEYNDAVLIVIVGDPGYTAVMTLAEALEDAFIVAAAGAPGNPDISNGIAIGDIAAVVAEINGVLKDTIIAAIQAELGGDYADYEITNISAANVSDDLVITLTLKDADGKSQTVKITIPGYAYNADVDTITVKGVAAVLNAGEYDVVLPYGTDISKLAAKDVVIKLDDAKAKYSTPETTDGGLTWTFTVTADDGVYTEDYIINVEVATLDSLVTAQGKDLLTPNEYDLAAGSIGGGNVLVAQAALDTLVKVGYAEFSDGYTATLPISWAWATGVTYLPGTAGSYAVKGTVDMPDGTTITVDAQVTVAN